jgi:hypothetical protein
LKHVTIFISITQLSNIGKLGLVKETHKIGEIFGLVFFWEGEGEGEGGGGME